MRKLFVIFLLVALVPFSVGCGIVDGDDDNPVLSTTSAPTVTLTPSVIVPSSFAANVRAQTFNGYDIPMMFNDVSYAPVSVASAGDGYTKLTYQIVTDTETIRSLTGKAFSTTDLTVPAQLYIYGQPVDIDIPTPEYEPGEDSYTGTAEVSVEIVGNTVTVTVNGTELPSQEVSPDNAFYVTNITTESGSSLTSDPTEPTTVTSTTPSFNVIFNHTPDNLESAEWTAKFTKINSAEYTYTHSETESYYNEETESSLEIDEGNSYTFDQGDGYFATQQNGNVVTVSLNSGTTKTLKAGSTYKVEFISSDLTGNSYKLFAVAPRYFQVQ